MKLGTIYISSRGLKKAEKTEVTSFTPPGGWNFENEYCCIRDYQASQMSRDELLEALKIQDIHKRFNNHDYQSY